MIYGMFRENLAEGHNGIENNNCVTEEAALIPFSGVEQEKSEKETTAKPIIKVPKKKETCYVAPYIYEDHENRKDDSSTGADLKDGMIVTGYKTDNNKLPYINKNIYNIRTQDQEILSSLERCSSGRDREVEKLKKELRDANNILANLEQNIELLKAKKELNQKELVLIKGKYKLLLEEKFNCEKQISLIRKDFYRIKDKRILRDFHKLGICYEKLCQKEMATRKQIALLEAELSMIVSKIDIPKSKGAEKSVNQAVPKLELSRLKKRENNGLPPVKNPPKAPRRGNTIYPTEKDFAELNTAKAKVGKTKLLKRTTAPRHSHGLAQTSNSNSASFLKGMVPRFSTEMEKDCYLPLLGNQKHHATRSQRDANGDNFEQKHTLEIKFPHITDVKEKKQVDLISDIFPVQKREPKKKGFLPKMKLHKIQPFGEH